MLFWLPGRWDVAWLPQLGPFPSCRRGQTADTCSLAVWQELAWCWPASGNGAGELIAFPMLCQDSKQHSLLSPKLPAFSSWLGDSHSPASETRLYQGVSSGQTAGMHCIFTTTQALHFCCCRCLLEGRREKLLLFLHPQGVWWLVFALSWPHQPSFLPNSHCFFPSDIHICEHQSPCQNGARCIYDRDGEYSCLCPEGFHGKDCEMKTGPCEKAG